MRGAITLKSGRVFEPESGILGIDDELEVFEGYDNHCDEWDGALWFGVEELTSAEKIELCEVMAERWNALKASLLKNAAE